MSNTNQFKDYEMNEADIDKAIHILSVFDPDNATPENAIDFLEWLRTGVHEMAHSKTPEELQKLYEQFTAQRELKR
jgi:hypothetical protein